MRGQEVVLRRGRGEKNGWRKGRSREESLDRMDWSNREAVLAAVAQNGRALYLTAPRLGGPKRRQGGRGSFSL